MWKLMQQNRRFARLVIATLISEMGSNFTYMLMMVMSYERTESLLGTMGIAISASIGSLVMGSVSGVLVERRSPVAVMVLFTSLQALLVGSLFFLPTNMWVYYAAAFVAAILRTFLNPVTRKYQLMVIAEDDMMNANAALTTARESLKIIGPMLAVFILSLFPPDLQKVGYLIDVASYLAVVLILLGLGLKHPEPEDGAAKPRPGKASFRQLWAEGFQPLKHPIIGTVVFNFLFIILGIGGADVILTAHVHQSGNPAIFVGYLFASLSAGLILTSMFGARWFSKWPLPIRLGGTVLALGVCEIMIAATSEIVYMMLAAFLLGMFNAVYNVSATTYMQLTVARDRIGRFFGLISSVFSAASLIGLAMNGLIGTFLTPQAVLFWTGSILSVFGLMSLMTITFAERRMASRSVEGINTHHM